MKFAAGSIEVAAAVEKVGAELVDGEIPLAARRNLDVVGLLAQEKRVNDVGAGERPVYQVLGVALLLVIAVKFVAGESDYGRTVLGIVGQALGQGKSVEPQTVD